MKLYSLYMIVELVGPEYFLLIHCSYLNRFRYVAFESRQKFKFNFNLFHKKNLLKSLRIVNVTHLLR